MKQACGIKRREEQKKEKEEDKKWMGDWLLVRCGYVVLR
jgi:hypothetical protein